MTVSAYKKTMTEDQMQTAITEAVTALGGRVFHIRDSRGAPEMADFPDLVVIVPSKNMVVFVELKSQRRAVTAGQHEVLAMLGGCHRVESFVVRPEPKASDELSYDALIAALGEGAAT